MSAEDGFLERWSRRKRAAGNKTRAEPAPAAPPAAEPVVAPAELPPLPPIDSIEAGSDISAFLAPGVPTALSQAALRRAWSADPAIRDFIGLSENSWDFTAGGGVPGFGAIDPDSVARLLDRVMGVPEPEAAAVVAPLPEDGAAGPTDQPAIAALPLPEDAAGEERHPDPVPLALGQEIAAVRHEARDGDGPAATARRRHGGALPD